VNKAATRLLLVAPAGSGKTEVLVRRIERVLAESPNEAFRILGVTYTVKASEELRTRLAATVSTEAWRVDCETLHGFALEWLMRYGRTVGIGPNVVVYSDDADRMSLIADYIRSLGLDKMIGDDLRETVGPIIRAIDDHRTLSPHLPVADIKFLGVDLSELYDAYTSALTRAGGIDFPGMLTKLIESFQVDPWVLQNFQSTYREILVDEGQDLTPAQTQVLRLLAGPGVNLFVVADERQSINNFAGGSFDNALAVVGPEHLRLTLQHNFRCSTSILSAAESIAAHMKSRPMETLTAPGAPPGKVTVVSATNQSDEARIVKEWVQQLLSNGLEPHTLAKGEDPRLQPEDIAVIARTRWILDPFIAALNEAELKVSFNLEPSGFLQTSMGRLFLDALALLADKSDKPAYRRFVEELGALGVVSTAETPVEALANSSSEELVALAAGLRLADDPARLDTLLSTLSRTLAHSDWWDDARAIEQLWLNYRAATDMHQRTVKGFLRFVARSQMAKASDPGIRVLTIHRVKGLEFRAVAIVGAREGALPDYRARTSTELDAERRGLYVAMTRAQRALHISWSQTTIDRQKRVHRENPSQFLRQAGLVE